MDMEKLFDINSYSEKNMPFASELFEKLNESYFLKKSEDFKNVERKKNFTDTEKALLDKMYAQYTDEMYVQQREWFNIGFRLGAMFVMEVCGR